jgi:integrase
LPIIGDKAASHIGKVEINDILDAFIDRDAPIAANRTLAVVKKLYRWALSRGYVDRDPCEGIAKPGGERKRDRVLSDEELAKVWFAADGISYPFGPAIRLLILTGARRQEVGAMRWSEVDLKPSTWTLPAERAKNGVEHLIPLSAAAATILSNTPRIGTTDEFVFTTTGKTAISGWSKAKATLDGQILDLAREENPHVGPFPHWTIHDLRRTVASGMAGLGISLPVVEKILNHISGSFGGVAGVYQRHSFSVEKREALDRWAAHVAVITNQLEESPHG